MSKSTKDLILSVLAIFVLFLPAVIFKGFDGYIKILSSFFGVVLGILFFVVGGCAIAEKLKMHAALGGIFGLLLLGLLAAIIDR